jgi:hypothetical protein
LGDTADAGLVNIFCMGKKKKSPRNIILEIKGKQDNVKKGNCIIHGSTEKEMLMINIT